MKNLIYLDAAASTNLLPEVKEQMLKYIDDFGNPSSQYQIGVNNREAINFARYQIADVLKCDPEEIIFTSGASESNSMAVISGYHKCKNFGYHIITSKIEHHSILAACEFLEKYCGVDVTYLDVDKYGRVSPDDVYEAINGNTILVSIQAANNEIGTIQNIKKIYETVKSSNPEILFHTDATQAFCHMELSTSNFDLMSFSGHKFGGPKGVGGLYIKKGINLPPYIFGTQEGNRRGGTQNVMNIVGIGKAAEISAKNMYEWNNYINGLTAYFCNRVLNEILGSYLNTSKPSLVNNVNIRFDGIRAEELLILLDMNGICCSSGSACNSSSNEPSHVLKAIGLSDEEANSSIRFSFSHKNTKEEIDYVVDKLKEFVEILRNR